MAIQAKVAQVRGQVDSVVKEPTDFDRYVCLGDWFILMF